MSATDPLAVVQWNVSFAQHFRRPALPTSRLQPASGSLAALADVDLAKLEERGRLTQIAAGYTASGEWRASMTVTLDRRSFTALAVASATFMACGGMHSQRGRHARVGFLIGDGFPTLVEAFQGELRRLGYIEGKNLVLEERVSRAPGDGQRQARELAAMNLDVIVAAALSIALELKALGTSTPVVVATTPGFVANGLAQTLQHPGGNFTGIDELPPNLTAKRLRLLSTAAPHVRKVALLSTTPGTVSHAIQLADAESEASKLGINVRTYRATSVSELETALSSIARDGMEGLLNFQGGLSLSNRDLIIDMAKRNRLPAVYQSKLFVESGGLMALSPDQEKQFRTAARYADKVVRGAKPGDLPIQYPGRYYLSVNLGAATSMGLQLPKAIRRRADFVFR